MFSQIENFLILLSRTFFAGFCFHSCCCFHSYVRKMPIWGGNESVTHTFPLYVTHSHLPTPSLSLSGSKRGEGGVRGHFNYQAGRSLGPGVDTVTKTSDAEVVRERGGRECQGAPNTHTHTHKYTQLIFHMSLLIRLACIIASIVGKIHLKMSNL